MNFWLLKIRETLKLWSEKALYNLCAHPQFMLPTAELIRLWNLSHPNSKYSISRLCLPSWRDWKRLLGPCCQPKHQVSLPDKLLLKSPTLPTSSSLRKSGLLHLMHLSCSRLDHFMLPKPQNPKRYVLFPLYKETILIILPQNVRFLCLAFFVIVFLLKIWLRNEVSETKGWEYILLGTIWLNYL